MLKKEEVADENRCLFCGKKVRNGTFFCEDCLKTIRGESEESNSYREGGSVGEGYLRLFEAVRLQAIEDKKLDDFESYWMKSEGWKAIWQLVEESFIQKQTVGSIENIKSITDTM